jgi:hypothetical protein
VLTRDDILKTDDLKREIIAVPEWGGEVCVRVMTGSERDQWEWAALAAKDNATKKGVAFSIENMRATLSAICICDETGKRIFTNADILELGKKSAAALDRVFQAAQRVNGLTAAAVEELEKN